MAIDPSIALNVRPMQLQDPADSIGKALTLKSLLSQDRLQNAKLDQIPLENMLTLAKAQAEQAKAGRDAQSDKLKLEKDKLDISVRLLGGVLSASDDQKPLLYQAARMKGIEIGAIQPDDPDYPEVWNPNVSLSIQRDLNSALTAKEQMERVDTAGLYGNQPAQVAPDGSDEPIVRPYTPNPGAAPLNTAVQVADINMRPNPEEFTDDWGIPPQIETRLPDENVDALPGDKLRLQAEAMRRRGNPAALKEAENLERRAKDADEAEFKRREQQQPVAGAPGVTFNKNTGKYMMDGREVSAAKVQEIADRNRKAGATQIGIGEGALGLGKAAANKIDEGLIDATARKSRLTNVERAYKPEFLEVGTRLSAAWSGIREKLGVGISAKDKQTLVEFTQWKQGALDNLNQYIKEITGAALSEAEAKRIMAALPNPGDSWYNGDSPTQFKAGMDRAIRDLKTAEARLVYIKRNGLSMDNVPLEKMPQIMNDRGRELEGVVKERYPKMKTEEIRATVKRQLAQEFGLTAD